MGNAAMNTERKTMSVAMAVESIGAQGAVDYETGNVVRLSAKAAEANGTAKALFQA